jgi:tetratricopeptide (TPR) repeat protein
VAALLASTNEVAAQAGGRVAGTVKDASGQPIEGAQVTATSPAMDEFRIQSTTNKKGKFVLAFSNSAMPYVVEIKKEGYKTLVGPINPLPGQTVMNDYVLPPATSDEQAVAEKAALSGAGRAVLVYNEGVEAQRTGDLDTAAKKYQEAATINPELAAAHTSLAAVAHLRGDFPTAAAEAEMALAIDPTDVRAMQLRFDSYRQSGDTVKAEEAAEALRNAGGASETAAQIFNEGAEAYNSGDVAAAISKFQQAAELDPTMAQARLVLAKVLYSKGGLSDALTWAQEVLVLEPENKEALQIAYDTALRLGQSEAASKALDQLVATDPEWATTGLFQQAVDLYNAGKTDDAVQALEKVLEVEPDHARAQYMIGVALFNSGETGPAAEHLRRFIELAPDDPDATIAKDLLAYAN